MNRARQWHWESRAPADTTKDNESETTADFSRPEPSRTLTSPERGVMTMLANGATGAEIAEALVISAETVRSRTRSARKRLGARTRIHAIALAVHSGEIKVQPADADRFR